MNYREGTQLDASGQQRQTGVPDLPEGGKPIMPEKGVGPMVSEETACHFCGTRLVAMT